MLNLLALLGLASLAGGVLEWDVPDVVTSGEHLLHNQPLAHGATQLFQRQRQLVQDMMDGPQHKVELPGQGQEPYGSFLQDRAIHPSAERILADASQATGSQVSDVDSLTKLLYGDKAASSSRASKPGLSDLAEDTNFAQLTAMATKHIASPKASLANPASFGKQYTAGLDGLSPDEREMLAAMKTQFEQASGHSKKQAKKQRAQQEDEKAWTSLMDKYLQSQQGGGVSGSPMLETSTVEATVAMATGVHTAPADTGTTMIQPQSPAAAVAKPKKPVPQLHTSYAVQGDEEVGSPCACHALYDPVCASDGKEYPHACWAKCAGVEVSHHGKCLPAHELGEIPSGDMVDEDDDDKPMPILPKDDDEQIDSLASDAAQAAVSDMAPRVQPPTASMFAWRPESQQFCDCPLIFAPVCDSKGTTHPSACYARCAGAVVVKDKPCDDFGQQMVPVVGQQEAPAEGTEAAAATENSKQTGLVDAETQTSTQTAQADVDPMCSCNLHEVDLQCGSDEVTYNSVCWAKCAGATVVHPGPCAK